MNVEIRKAMFTVLTKIDRSMGFVEKPLVHKTAILQQRTFVAYVNGKAVGYIRYGWFLWDRRAPFIQMIRVAKSARRQGVARELIEKVMTIARTNGCVYMYSSTDENNKTSIALHAALGFEQCGKIVMPDQKEEEIFYVKSI